MEEIFRLIDTGKHEELQKMIESAFEQRKSSDN
jgi:hypothetical protein